jgi:SnoaL-like polyketide cyclase
VAAVDQATRNEELARRWVEEVLNRGNSAAVDELMVPESQPHVLFGVRCRPSWMPGGCWLEQVKRAIARDVTGLERRQTTVDYTVSVGDKVLVVASTTGTRSGEKISYSTIIIQRFADGKMVEAWQQFDRLGVYQQLVMLPEMPELLRQAGLQT